MKLWLFALVLIVAGEPLPIDRFKGSATGEDDFLNFGEGQVGQFDPPEVEHPELPNERGVVHAVVALTFQEECPIQRKVALCIDTRVKETHPGEYWMTIWKVNKGELIRALQSTLIASSPTSLRQTQPPAEAF